MVNKVLKKIESYILILGIFFCALSIDPNSMDIMPLRYVLWSAVAIILFISITYRAIKYSDVDFSILKRVIFPAFAVYLLVSGFSLLFAPNVSEGLYQILKIFLMMVFVFEATVVIEKKSLIKSMVALAIILGAFGIWQHFTIEVVTLRAGTLSNKNLLSSALLLLLPFCVYSLFVYRWKIISLFAVIAVLFNIITLQSRAVWLALFVGLLVVLAVRKKLIIGICVLSVLFGSVYFLIPEETKDQVTGYRSLVNRFQIWSASLDMFKENPLGVGIGNWPTVIQKYGKGITPADGGLVSKELVYIRAHNEFVQNLTELGPLGLACYLGLFISALYYACKSCSYIALSCLVIYLVVAFFSFLGERAFHPMILSVVMGMSLATYHKRKNVVFATHKLYLMSLAVLAILSLSLVDFWHRYDTARILKPFIIKRYCGNLNDSLLDLNGYPNWFATLDPLGMPIIQYIGEWAFFKKEYSTALMLYKQAEKLHPHNIYILNNIGSIYLILGDQDKAIEYLEKVLEISPSCEPAQANIRTARKIKGIL